MKVCNAEFNLAEIQKIQSMKLFREKYMNHKISGGMRDVYLTTYYKCSTDGLAIIVAHINLINNVFVVTFLCS